MLGQLSVGGAVLLSLPSLTTVGINFYRTNGIVFWITLLLGIVIGGSAVPAASVFYFLFLGVLAIYNLRLWFRHPYHSRVLLWSAGILGTIGFLLLLQAYLPQFTSPLRRVGLFLYSMLSSLLLGAGVLAMLLGHSYLTRPTLSIVPLRQLTQIFMGLVFAEGAVAVINLITVIASERIMDALLFKTFEGLYLWIRFAIGMIGPMILAPMIWATVKERSTMAATGLLYIAMLMVIIGALFSRFFLFVHADLI